jgi:1,4-dihydroxy-2-naphthoyl-CoA synthase
MKNANEEGTTDPHGSDVEDITPEEVDAYNSIAGPRPQLSNPITPKKTQEMMYQVFSRL